MSAYVRELKDNNGDTVYPPSLADAIYMKNGVDTVGRILEDQIDQNTNIVFGTGTITETLASGSVVLTEFMQDGSIRETTTNKDGVVVQIKTTTFNDDGSISITIKEEEES
jgi:hypothetical protein